MSQYINFYIKDKSNNFNPLDSYSRNTPIYQKLKYLPYETGTPLTILTINDTIISLLQDIQECNNDIKDYYNKIPIISSMNNSTQEKLEAISCINDNIDELTNVVEELQNAKNFFNFLKNILENASYLSSVNENEYIYAGIEWIPEEN